jgi:hypothetical protein
VNLIGTSRERTVFRALHTGSMFQAAGGSLQSFSAYGTRTAELSGEKWKVGTGGRGRGGTASAAHIIIVDEAEDVRIHNVHLAESRYDCLYVRTCSGLRVTSCSFDRAGRNICSLVGNTADFLIADCVFGSHWGLYHVDIEPNSGKWVRDGAFVNCTFDGRRAGEMGTDTWGAFVIFCGEEGSENVSVIGCRFLDISIRVRGIFPACSFLYNDPVDTPGPAFIRVRTNPVGELRDVTVKGNRFLNAGRPASKLTHNVAFTGESVFAGNFPAAFNDVSLDARGRETDWGDEDHPIDQQAPDAPEVDIATEGGVTTVEMPLMGHEFRFADGTVHPYRSASETDLSMHLDPILALGGAGIQLLGEGELRSFGSPPEEGYGGAAYGARSGLVYAVRTNQGAVALMRIEELGARRVRFQYWLP